MGLNIFTISIGVSFTSIHRVQTQTETNKTLLLNRSSILSTILPLPIIFYGDTLLQFCVGFHTYLKSMIIFNAPITRVGKFLNIMHALKCSKG